MMFLKTAALLLASAISANGLKLEGLFNNKNVPSTGQEWISVSQGQEVQPADFSNESPEEAAKMRATLQRMLTNGNDYYDYDSNFVDGSTPYYDDEQQSWRYLGLFIDCNPEAEIEDDGDDDDQEERLLSGSGDDGRDNTCARYVLWAAYIDPYYEGGGIGEYQFWDRHKGNWDRSACEESGTRCAYMDCHLPSTEFKLLGFFKEPEANEWMDQLFKHEGYCTWTESEYEFMQDYSGVWPEGCEAMNINDHHGNPLYMDIKPLPGGDWTIGFYNDEICTMEHSQAGGWNGLTSMSDMAILQAYNKTGQDEGSHDGEEGDLLSLAQNINSWNDGLAMWKQCHPCRTYNIGNGQDATYYNDDYAANDDDAANDDAADDDGRRRRRRRVEDGGDDAYTCNDDADYTNVNQCMKFFAKSDMQVATIRNMMLANAQGSIVEIDLANGKTLGSDRTINALFSLKKTMFAGPHSNYPGLLEVIFFLTSLSTLVLGAAFFFWAWTTKGSKRGSSFEHPLVESEGEMA